ncbi:MAG: TonB-dependent receptor [Xanthomonadales bacterium]|nr:TonB-dependent receptor [Xanthomonadales bacterium]
MSVILLPVQVAWAQTAASDNEAQAPGLIEEVVVTARHREESLQEVPLSISAINGDTIAQERIISLQGLEYSVPNLVFGETGSSGETFIGIRGIGDFSRNIGFDTRVGVYMDGVFAGQSLSVDQGLVDIAQVEVLRGPQGTLFGKNSSSGVINIVSNRPVIGQDGGTSSGELRLRAGNLDTLGGTGIISIPLGDTVAARFAVMAQNQDGYIDNLFNGKNLMTNDYVLGRGSLRFRPSDALDINWTFDVRSQDNDLVFLEPDASFENTVGNPQAAPAYVVDQDADLIDETDGWGTGLTVDYNLANDFVLTSITGYRSVDRKVGSDEDATRVFTLNARYFADDFAHFTQELRLASPGDQRFRYVLGAYYFDQTADTDRKVALGPGFGGPSQGVDAAVQDSSVDTQSWALFINGNFDVTDRVSISGGLRWTDESKDAAIHQMVFPGFGLALLVDEAFTRDENYLTATASVNFQINEQMNSYFTYANGYKSGGWNVDLVASTDDLPYEEETVDSYEVGLKSDLLDGKLRLNLSAFYATYDDYQVFQFRFDPFSGTTALLVSNAAQVTTMGFEAEGTAIFGDAFSLDFGVGYTNASFDDFPGGAVDGTTGAPVNVAGNVLPRAPEWTLALTGRYQFQLGSTANSLMLNYTYRDSQYFNPDNLANSYQPAYGLWNAAWDIDFNEHWGLALYGRNLGDSEYRSMRGISFLGIPFSLYAQTRTYGVEAIFRF